MKISTVHDGALIEGVVLKRSPSFVEIAITSPFSKLSTCKNRSSTDRISANVCEDDFHQLCRASLIELYQVARVIKRSES